MDNLITKTDALNLLGITTKKFDTLSIQPAKVLKNPYKRGAFMYLYPNEAILTLKGTEQVKALLPKVRVPKDYSPIFAKRYTTKESALQDVCRGLFYLNRYTKHNSCSTANKEEIYSLKSSLIEYLYSNGYCVSVELHTQSGCTKERFNRETNEYEDGYEWENNLYLFLFDIEGVTYRWHQPEECVDFHISDICGAKEIGEIGREKPISMASAKFKEAKELIRWFLR